MCSRATATRHCYLYEESHFWHYFGPLDTIDTSRHLIYPEPRYPPRPQASALSKSCLGTSPPWRFLSSMCRWTCVFPTCMSVSLRPPAVESSRSSCVTALPCHAWIPRGFLARAGHNEVVVFRSWNHDTHQSPSHGLGRLEPILQRAGVK